MSALNLKIEVAAPAFFSTDPKRLKVEAEPNTGRVYFLDRKGHILAVGRPLEAAAPGDAKEQ